MHSCILHMLACLCICQVISLNKFMCLYNHMLMHFPMPFSRVDCTSFTWLIRALALGNANAILFYHSKNSLYHYTILFYNTSTSQNSISIKILIFNIFLLFLYNCQFFSDPYFLGFPTNFFFPLLLPQPLATHKPSTTTATDQLKPPIHGTKNQTTDQLKPPINPSTTTATAPPPISTSTHHQPQPRHLKPSTTTTTATAPKTHQPMPPI